MNNFNLHVLDAIKKYKMLSENDKVLIALSGGKDSVALLLFFAEFARELKITLFSAHVNHMIRGESADSDEKFCYELCQKLNIPFFSKKIHVPEISRQTSMSIEEAARKVRYEYLNSICDEYSLDKIATAHTASDNTETVLYNIARGCGLQGICGIPPVRDNIIRPLIFCTKEETKQYCDFKNTLYCVDETNFQDCYDRNNIRNNVIPHMKKRNPSLDVSVSRLSYIAKCDRMLISSIADNFLIQHGNILPLEETAKLFEDEKMMSCAHEIICKISNLTIPFDIFMQCKNIITSRKTGKKVKLSNDVYLTINYDKIEIKREFKPIEYYQTVLLPEKRIKINGKINITLSKEENVINYKNINNLTMKATFNFDKIYGDIFARKKKDGDSYSVSGMTRSVKKFFIDSKISREMREYTPVICDAKGIIWVPGMKVCDRVIPDKNGNNITIIVEFSE